MKGEWLQNVFDGVVTMRMRMKGGGCNMHQEDEGRVVVICF